MKVFKYLLAVVLCASASPAAFGAEVRLPDNDTPYIPKEVILPDNDTRYKIIHKAVASDLAGKIFTTVLMPIPGVETKDVIGHASLNAFDNAFNDDSVPPRLINNPMMEIGVNVKHGSSRAKGKPAIWLGMEDSYYCNALNPPVGGRLYSEWYLSGMQPDGTTFRPLYAGWDADNQTKFTTVQMHISKNSGFYINTVGEKAPLFGFTGSGMADLPIVYVSKYIQVKGETIFGTDDHAMFSSSGQLALTGKARVRKALIIPASRAAPGVISPVLAQRAIGASGGIKVPVLSFSPKTEQSVYIEIYAPLDIDDSADVELQALWQPAPGWSRGNCVWKFEYLVKDETGDFTTETPAIISSNTRPINTKAMQKAVFSTRLDVNKRQVIQGRFYRDVASDDGDAAAELRCLKIEYTSNKLGEAY